MYSVALMIIRYVFFYISNLIEHKISFYLQITERQTYKDEEMMKKKHCKITFFLEQTAREVKFSMYVV